MDTMEAQRLLGDLWKKNGADRLCADAKEDYL